MNLTCKAEAARYIIHHDGSGLHAQLIMSAGNFGVSHDQLRLAMASAGPC